MSSAQSLIQEQINENRALTELARSLIRSEFPPDAVEDYMQRRRTGAEHAAERDAALSVLLAENVPETLSEIIRQYDESHRAMLAAEQDLIRGAEHVKETLSGRLAEFARGNRVLSGYRIDRGKRGPIAIDEKA
ncbi:MAG: hypothetical protein ACE5FN_05900 [Leptospirillia bacterium]